MKLNGLIVDDNEFDRYLLKRWLGTCSFEMDISEATDGRNAIEYFEENAENPSDGFPPDIIFLDINMPRVNGLEFLEKFATIRKELGLSSTVVVMFSSSPRQDDKENAFQWDFVDGFIVKGEFGTESIETLVLGHIETINAS